MEEELQKAHKLESLGLLAGGIAHDFNNLLTGILGNISLSKVKSEPESKVFEILSQAEKATLRASALTQQLLTFSKGGEPIRMSTNITDLLKDSTNFVLSGSKVLSIYDIQNNLWPVDVDRGQISQVVHNLTLNALEAMPDGGTLQVYANNESIDEKNNHPLKPGKYVKLIFKDKGTGIEKENLNKIFDPYFTTKETGNGLGLSATYSIIKKHNGFIGVDSEPGTGTTISIYLPSSEKYPSAEMMIDKKILPGTGRILIMDDEEIIRDFIIESLTSIGYQVDVTKDGEETIQYYREALKKEAPYDAVILDLTIPGGKGGKETIKEIHKINPAAKVIVSSGYSNDPIMADYKKYGFAGVVPKPFNISELSNVLHEIIPQEYGSETI
jgi:CheY-like chemotaxis protein